MIRVCCSLASRQSGGRAAREVRRRRPADQWNVISAAAPSIDSSYLPSAAALLQRARWWSACCPACTPAALTAPRLERRVLQGASIGEAELPRLRPAPALIALRCAVASRSLCPPERKTMPGTAAGTCRRKHAQRRRRDLRHRRALGDSPFPATTMFGLSSIPSSDDALGAERVEDARRSTAPVTSSAARDASARRPSAPRARRWARAPAPGRAPRSGRARARSPRCRCRSADASLDVDDRAPLGEARAQRPILLQPIAQAVETFGDRLAGAAGERLGAGVDLDAGHDALRARAASTSGDAVARRSGGSSRRRGSRR